jgi:outer membrane protein OmpA-like peptidoglycan-associated protein
MLKSPTFSFLIALLMVCAFSPHVAMGSDVNQFYGKFVTHLKNSEYDRMEGLVRRNPAVAESALDKVREKLEAETDPARKEAYAMVSRELKELISVTVGSGDCAMSAAICRRGAGVAIAGDALEAFRRAVVLCPDNVEALLGLGEVFYSAGLYHRGAEALEQALRSAPENKKAKVLLADCLKQGSLDTDGLIPSGEIVDRLWEPVGGALMCMCPMHAKLIGRVRFRAITFSTGSASLDASAKEQLKELAAALKTDTLKNGRYLLEGYADPSGLSEYNLLLSHRRADAARRYLVEALGVNPAILATAGAGDARSWTEDETPAGRRANRRLEIISLGHVNGEYSTAEKPST